MTTQNRQKSNAKKNNKKTCKQSIFTFTHKFFSTRHLSDQYQLIGTFSSKIVLILVETILKVIHWNFMISWHSFKGTLLFFCLHPLSNLKIKVFRHVHLIGWNHDNVFFSHSHLIIELYSPCFVVYIQFLDRLSWFYCYASRCLFVS